MPVLTQWDVGKGKERRKKLNVLCGFICLNLLVKLEQKKKNHCSEGKLLKRQLHS